MAVSGDDLLDVDTYDLYKKLAAEAQATNRLSDGYMSQVDDDATCATSVNGSMAIETPQVPTHSAEQSNPTAKTSTVNKQGEDGKKALSGLKQHKLISAVERKYAIDDAKLRHEVQRARLPSKQQLGGRFFSSDQLLEKNLAPHVLVKARNPLRQVQKSDKQKVERKATGKLLLAQEGIPQLRNTSLEEQATMYDYLKQASMSVTLPAARVGAVPASLLDTDAGGLQAETVAMSTPSGTTIIMASGRQVSLQKSNQHSPSSAPRQQVARVAQTYRGDSRASIPYGQQQRVRQYQQQILDLSGFVEETPGSPTSHQVAKVSSPESVSKYRRAKLASRLGVGANATFGSILAFSEIKPPDMPLPPSVPNVEPPFSVFPTVAMFRSFQRLAINPNPALLCDFVEQRRPDGTLKPPQLATKSVVLLRSKVLQRLLLAALPFEVVSKLKEQQHAERQRREQRGFEKKPTEMNFLFQQTWARVSKVESTPFAPGSALASDYSGNGWGMSDTYDKYSGTAAKAVNQSTQASAGVTQMLLQSSDVPFGWQGSVLDLRGWHISPHHIRSLATFGEHIEVLRLTAWQSRNLDHSSLDLIFNSFPKLCRVSLPGCPAFDSRASELLAASSLPSRLTELDISSSEKLNDQALMAVGASCIQLQDLNLSCCAEITDRALIALSTDLAQLQALDLSWCLKVTDRGIIPLLARCPVEHFAVRGLGMCVMRADDATRVADLAGLDLNLPSKIPKGWDLVQSSNDDVPVYDNTGQRIATGCRPGDLLVPAFAGLRGGEWLRQSLMDALVEVQISSLRTIDMSMCVGVTDEVLISLLRNSTGLERLRLSHCASLTAASTTAIALFCPEILEVHIPFCTGITSPIVDRDVALLLAKRAGLIRDASGALSSEADAGITVGISKMMQRQENSRMRYSVPFFPGDELDIDAKDPAPADQLAILQPKWHNLRVLNASGASGIQELDFCRLVKCCAHLEELGCSGVHNISSNLLGDLKPLSLPLLRVSLGYLPALDDMAMKTLVECAPDLQQLDITGSTSVSDAGLARVSMSCPLLEEFRFNGCSRAVSCGAVMALAKSCRMLRVLEVSQQPDKANFSDRSGPFARVSGASEIDYSFDGNLLLFIVGLGLCCPYLEVLDVSGRHLPQKTFSPRGLGASVQLDGEVFAAGSARGLVQRAKASNVLGVSKRSSEKMSSLLSGKTTVEEFVGPDGTNLVSTSFRASQQLSKELSASKSGRSGHATIIPLVASKKGPVASESMFAELKSLNLSHCSHINTDEAQQLVAAAPQLLQLDVTGVETIDKATLASLGNSRELVNFCVEYDEQQSAPVAQSAILGFPGQRPGSRANINLGDSLASESKKLLAKHRTQPTFHTESHEKFVGFKPVPGASFLIDSTLASKRIGLERLSANKIRRLVLHGLRIQKQLLFTITWRVATKRSARLQYSARRVTRFMRHSAAVVQLRKQLSVAAIVMWWRRLQLIFRCQERVMAAVNAKRAAQTKVLAASLLLQSFNSIWQRLGFNWLRMRALVGRWEDERRINRLRGLVPRYDTRGRLNVQFALPDEGPEILGEKGPAASVIPARPATRQGEVRSSLASRITAAQKAMPRDALTKLVQDKGGLRLRKDSDDRDHKVIRFDDAADADKVHTAENESITPGANSNAVRGQLLVGDEPPASDRASKVLAQHSRVKRQGHDALHQAMGESGSTQTYLVRNPSTSLDFVAKFLFGEPLEQKADAPLSDSATQDVASIVASSPDFALQKTSSPYRVVSGKIHAVLSNPARVGWDNPIKARPVSDLHEFLHAATAGRKIPGSSILLQLANSQAPIESMQAVLGPRAFIAAAKKRIAIELEERLQHRSSWKEQQQRLLKACQKRSHQAAARKIQLFYRQHLFDQVVMLELDKATKQVEQMAEAANQKKGMHRQAHSGAASKAAVKSAIIIQKAARYFSARIFAVQVRRAKALSMACDSLRVAAAQVSGYDGEFQSDHLAQTCSSAKESLMEALNATEAVSRVSRFFRESQLATKHRDNLIHAMQMCSNIPTGLSPADCKQAATMISEILQGVSGGKIPGRCLSSSELVAHQQPDHDTIGALYNTSGFYLQEHVVPGMTTMIAEVRASTGRRFAHKSTLGQRQWLQDSSRSSAGGSGISIVDVNPLLCSHKLALDVLYIIGSSGVDSELSSAITLFLLDRSHQLVLPPHSTAEKLPGAHSSRTQINNFELFENQGASDHEIVCGGLKDVAVLLDRASEVVAQRSMGEHKTIAVAARSRQPGADWGTWRLICTVLARNHLVPVLHGDGQHSVDTMRLSDVAELFVHASETERLSQSVADDITRQAHLAVQLSGARSLQISTGLASGSGTTPAATASNTEAVAEPKDNRSSELLAAEFSEHATSNPAKKAAEALAFETYLYSHGLLDWAATIAFRLAREQRHWEASCLLQRQAQALSLAAFKVFFAEELPMLVQDAEALVQHSQTQSHNWITRWQRSFKHLEERAETMPKFSDISCRLNYERQQLRVALMRSRMASEQSHISFAKQGLLVLNEIQSQQQTLLDALQSRTQQEERIVLQLEEDISKCQSTLDFVRERLGRLVLSSAHHRAASNQASLNAQDERNPNQDEADELAALVAMMSGDNDASDEAEYGVAQQTVAPATQSESDAPKQSFERILQVEAIDDEWERVQIEKVVEVEVPVAFPWRESGEWTEHRNEAGQVYFFNKNSKESQWEEPDWPIGQIPQPITEKVHKVEWTKRRCATSNHERRKRAKQNRQQAFQARSSSNMVQRLLSDTSLQNFASSASPQEREMEKAWLKSELTVLEDTLERLQNVLFLSTASFHEHNQKDHKLLTTLQEDLEILQKAVEEHRRAKVEVLQLQAEMATNKYFITNTSLVQAIAMLARNEGKHSKPVARIYRRQKHHAAAVHAAFSKVVPLKKPQYAIVEAAIQRKLLAPRKIVTTEQIVTKDAAGNDVVAEQRVISFSAPRKRRFRHARAPPTATSLLFYSSTDDGEDIANEAFWYTGGTRSTVFGVFGIQISFAGGAELQRVDSSEEDSGLEESKQLEAEREKAKQEIAHLQKVRQDSRNKRRKKASRAVRKRSARAAKANKSGSQKLFADLEGTPAEGKAATSSVDSLKEYVAVLQGTIDGFSAAALERQSELAREASFDVLAATAHAMQLARKRGATPSEIFVETLHSYPSKVSSECQEHLDALLARPASSSNLVAQEAAQPSGISKVLPKSSAPELRLLARTSAEDRSDGEFTLLFKDELEAEQAVEQRHSQLSLFSEAGRKEARDDEEKHEIARKSPFPWKQRGEEWRAGMSAPRAGAWGSTYFVHVPSKLALWAPPSVATRTSMIAAVRKEKIAEAQRKAELEARKAADLRKRRAAAKNRYDTAVAQLHELRKTVVQICHKIQSEAPDATEQFLNQPFDKIVAALSLCTAEARAVTGANTSDDFPEYCMQYPYAQWKDKDVIPLMPQLADIVCRFASRVELATFTKRIFDVQAALDSQDRKEWWALMELTDQQNTENRGFGGGAYFADPPEQYSIDLQTALDRAVDRLLKCESDEQALRFKILKTISQLHDAVRRQPCAAATTSVKALRERSTEESDAIARRKFDRAARQKIQAAQESLKLRLAQKSRLIFDISADSGTTDEELVARLRERARASRMAKHGVASVQPDEVVYDSDEEAFFEWKRDNLPKFVSEGFKGVIGPDGSALHFLGDGTRFVESSWLHRFKLRPWATGAKLLESLSIGERAAAINSSGDVDLSVLKDYKLGLSTMASSGLESKRERVEEKRRKKAAKEKAKNDEELRMRAEKIRRKIEREVSKQQDYRRQVGVNSSAQAKLTTKEIKSVDRDHASTLAMKGRQGVIKKLGDGLATKLASFSRSVRDGSRKLLKGNAPELDSNGYQLHRVIVSDKTDSDLRKREAEGELAAVHKVRFIGGKVANAHFARQQAHQHRETSAFKDVYFRLKGNLGSEDFPVHVWYTRTSNMLEAAGHMIMNSLSPEDPLFDDLQFNGYNYYTDEKVMPGHALWLMRGTGAPITSMAIANDHATQTRLKSQRFVPVQGGWGESLFIGKTAQLFYKTEVVLRVNSFRMDETRILESELYHLRALHEIVKQRLDSAKMDDTAPRPEDVEKDSYLRQEIKRLDGSNSPLQEGRKVVVAAEVFGFSDAQVAKLREAFDKIGLDRSEATTLPTILRYTGVRAAPLYDAMVLALDKNFDGVMTFGVFMRTIVTLCMHDFEDLCGFMFAIVAPNLMDAVQVYKTAHNALFRDSTSLHTWWQLGSAWRGPGHRSSPTLIPVLAVEVLLKSMHPPTPIVAKAVKRAIDDAMFLSTGDCISFYQFLALAKRHIPLFHPVLEFQQALRRAFPATGFWKQPVKNFGSIRSSWRDQLLSRDIEHQQRATVWLQELDSCLPSSADVLTGRADAEALTLPEPPEPVQHID